MKAVLGHGVVRCAPRGPGLLQPFYAHAARESELQASRAPPARETGQILLILLVTLALATVLVIYGSTTEIGRIVKAENRTRAVLEQARQALIGRAVGDANRPGSLPCPDGDDDGSADLFVGSACPTYIGRLPWRTLGTGDLRDETGERLWYALSASFRDHPSAPAINSDTRGTFTVFSASDATVMATQAIAVVFAPGFALPGQRRDDNLELCSTTAKTVQRNRCAAHYLDTAGSTSNASVTGPFIAAAQGALYNDKLAVIVAADMMPLVERRVALELRNALLAYRTRSACACYPWADGKAGTSRGRVPVPGMPEPWPAGTLPAYIAANDWGRVIYYAVGRSALENKGAACATCAQPSLSVDGESGHDVVLITPGYAVAPRATTAWNDYIDDDENRNGDDRFVTPASQGADRDRLYSIVGAESGCAVAARVLIDNVPCAMPDNAVRGVCASAGAALAGCRCAGAAAQMVKAPCAAALGAAQCEQAIVKLRGCTS